MGEENCSENGLCLMHGSEVERRKGYATELEAIKGRVGELLTFKNRMIGFGTGIGVFAVLVMVGSYTYTYNHMRDAEGRYIELAAQTKKVDDVTEVLRRDVYETKVQLARTDERYQALQNQLRSIDSRLEQLLVKIEQKTK